MAIAAYIREIGRGRDGARSLDAEQAHDLMSQVLDGRVSDLEVGAFALAMRIKGESVAELHGFLRATEERCLALVADRPAVALPSYNGARKLPNLTALLALRLAGEGVRVLVHGPLEDAGRVATAEVLRTLGIAPCTSAAEVQGAWLRGKPAMVEIATLCPPLARLLAVRRVVGLRNSGHTIAKLLAGCRGQVMRVVNYTHPEYATLLTEFMAASHGDAVLMRGTEGEPVADARRLRALNVFIDGQPRADLSHPAQEGALATMPTLPCDPSAASTAAYIQAVLDGSQPLPTPIAIQIDCLRESLSVLSRGAKSTRVLDDQPAR